MILTNSLLVLAAFASIAGVGTISTSERALIPRDNGECKSGWQGCPGNVNVCINCVSQMVSALIYGLNADKCLVPQARLQKGLLRRLDLVGGRSSQICPPSGGLTDSPSTCYCE